MADPDLPPQPQGDTRDLGGAIRSSPEIKLGGVTIPAMETRTFASWVGDEEVLGLCTACGKWKGRVGQWGGPNSAICCWDCWHAAFPNAGKAVAPGNPLNL